VEEELMQAHLVAAGKYHDIDYARLELLKLLAEQPIIRTSVACGYADGARIAQCDLLITYTCDLVPSDAELPALKAFLDRGGRWIALHGTNSIIRFGEDGRATTPDEAPDFMAMLGTRFLGHPPIKPFAVRIVNPDHSVTRGLRDFSVEDELYVSARTAEIDLLMAATFEGDCPDFADALAPDPEVPILYERRVGDGAILYCTLGHCRGHYDLQPLVRFWPHPQRCAWDYPVFTEILRRAIRWGMKQAA
jgi:uncharacterized protein